MALTYIKIYHDWKQATSGLTDAEKGRLIDALVSYSIGEEKVAELRGREGILYPMFRATIDRDRAAYEEISRKRAEAGAKGGKEKASNDSEC